MSTPPTLDYATPKTTSLPWWMIVNITLVALAIGTTLYEAMTYLIHDWLAEPIGETVVAIGLAVWSILVGIAEWNVCRRPTNGSLSAWLIVVSFFVIGALVTVAFVLVSADARGVESFKAILILGALSAGLCFIVGAHFKWLERSGVDLVNA